MKKIKYPKFAKALFDVRGNQSLELLGLKLGVTRGYISQLEGGNKKPSKSFFHKVNSKLGITTALMLVEIYLKDLEKNLEESKYECSLLRALPEDSKK